MSAVSEDDKDVPNHEVYKNYYAPPGEFPPLEMHLSENIGVSSVSDLDGLTDTSADNCSGRMPPKPQKKSPKVKDVTKRHRRTSSSSIISLKHKRKRYRRISSISGGSVQGSVQGNCLVFISADF
jgi:hypothetical protein